MIDYELLSKASEYYSKAGYQKIEVPWMVTEAVDSITRPSCVKPLIVSEKNKNLIASGEQGFLYLMLKGYLPRGKYQTITPCFRNDQYDFTHSKTFMKLELIDTEDITNGLSGITRIARDFFKTIFDEKDVNHTWDNNVLDLNYKDVEIGSYGYRKYKHLEWVYGTGLAEPRTSRLLKQI